MIFMTRAQMREYDRLAIEDYGIPGMVLMENAGRGAANVTEQHLSPTGSAAVVAGGGNNGGDGFVVARHLTNRGYQVRVYLVAPRNKLSCDAQANLDIFSKMGGVVVDCPAEGALAAHFYALEQDQVIVDALLGTGLTREVRGPVREAIELLNRLSPPKLALDIPSGVCADSGQVLGAAVRAKGTVTFGFLKRGLLLFPGSEMAGVVRVVDIGAPAVAAERAGQDGQLLQEDDVRGLTPSRSADVHKGTFGHLLVMAGSLGKTGAAILCAEAAMRTGAGLVTVVSTREGQRALETKTREVMVEHVLERTDSPLSKKALEKMHRLLEGKAAIAVGPGCSTNPAVTSLVVHLLGAATQPMVVDADGLTILAEHPDALGNGAGRVVLTPHPGEMARLMGTNVAEVQADRVGAARSQAERFEAVVVLKGAHTVIATPEGKLFVNPTGNPGMASAGSGDVLTGVIASLLAQGLESLEAACLGVYLHGVAGDCAAASRGERGLVATDLIAEVPTVLRRWEQGETAQGA